MRALSRDWLRLIFVCTVSAVPQTRIATIGSNPYLSWEMFPQDIAQWHGNFVTIYPQYQKSPWWGDIDEPGNKPRATYTTTGTQIIETEAFFDESAKLHTSSNLFGYAYRPSPDFMSTVDFDYNINGLRDRAAGNFTSKDTTGRIIGYVPFDYSLRHTLNSLTLRGAMAFNIFSVPAGLKLNVGYDNSLALKTDFTFSKNGSSYSTDRALWGWTTSPCAHIFGALGVQADAWLQNDYAVGPLFRGEIQLGMSLPKAKVGALVRYKAGRQDQYSWTSDTSIHTGDLTIDRNFMGSYQKSDWAKKSRVGAAQLYSNIHMLEGERFGCNTFVSLTYEGLVERHALSENLDAESSSKELQRGGNLEIVPNINIKLGPSFHYIDAGVMLKYGYTRFNNVYERWVGGGTVETYYDAATNRHDEDVWENFSYANQNTVDAGIDFSAMFPVLDNNYGQLGLGLILLGYSSFNFKTKYYGTNSDNGSQNTFAVNNRRENFTRELFFNSALALNYMRLPYYIRLEVTEPVLHSLLFRTRITDAEDTDVIYKHRKEPLWLSLQGLRIACFFSYEMRLPFLKY